MGVWDRDYSQSEHGYGEGWSARLPPRATLTLVVLHVAGMILAAIVRHDEASAGGVLFQLRGSVSHPAAIFLHPVGADSLFSLIFVVYVIWSLGRLIQDRLGAGHMLLLYVFGNLLGGTIYFGFAGAAPELSAYPLTIPAGGFAAWTLAAWRNFKFDAVSVFGKMTTLANVVAIGAAIVAGLTFFRGGPAATAWLLAAGAGALAYPLITVVYDRLAGLDLQSTGNRLSAPTTAPRPRPRRHVTDDADIDAILAKISREGIDSLSDAERERLDAARRRAAGDGES